MNETEWMAIPDPKPMLEFLRDKASDRKLRLFAVACCQRISHLLTDERSQIALGVAERHADGLASQVELFTVSREVNLADSELSSARGQDFFLSTGSVEMRGVYASAAACHLLGEPVDTRATFVGECAVKAVSAMPGTRRSPIHFAENLRLEEMAAQCQLLHEICGNPFRHLRVDPRWLGWNERIVVKLAQGIYTDRAFDRMPILHDALLDAGCAEEALILHCRNPKEHVRGCWVVDLILGKE